MYGVTNMESIVNERLILNSILMNMITY